MTVFNKTKDQEALAIYNSKPFYDVFIGCTGGYIILYDTKNGNSLFIGQGIIHDGYPTMGNIVDAIYYDKHNSWIFIDDSFNISFIWMFTIDIISEYTSAWSLGDTLMINNYETISLFLPTGNTFTPSGRYNNDRVISIIYKLRSGNNNTAYVADFLFSPGNNPPLIDLSSTYTKYVPYIFGAKSVQRACDMSSLVFFRCSQFDAMYLFESAPSLLANGDHPTDFFGTVYNHNYNNPYNHAALMDACSPIFNYNNYTTLNTDGYLGLYYDENAIESYIGKFTISISGSNVHYNVVDKPKQTHTLMLGEHHNNICALSERAVYVYSVHDSAIYGYNYYTTASNVNLQPFYTLEIEDYYYNNIGPNDQDGHYLNNVGLVATSNRGNANYFFNVFMSSHTETISMTQVMMFNKVDFVFYSYQTLSLTHESIYVPNNIYATFVKSYPILNRGNLL
jgi:hypothetical protein